MKTCGGCGREFVPITTTRFEQRWCTKRCGSAARKRIQRDLRQAERQQLRASAATPGAAPLVTPRARVCEICDAAYVPCERAASSQRFCSTACSNRARSVVKHRERLAEIDARLTTSVAERRRMQSLLLAQPLVNGQRCARCTGNLIVQADERLMMEVVCLACGERPATLPSRLERLFSRLAGLVA